MNGKVQSQWPTLADLILPSTIPPPGVRQSLWPSGPLAVCSSVPRDREHSREEPAEQRRRRDEEMERWRGRRWKMRAGAKRKDGLCQIGFVRVRPQAPSVLFWPPSSLKWQPHIEITHIKSDLLLSAAAVSFLLKARFCLRQLRLVR